MLRDPDAVHESACRRLSRKGIAMEVCKSMIATFGIGFLSIVLLTVAGCQPQPQIRMNTPFSITDYENYKGKGTGKIYGQAFLKTRGGDVKTGAGSSVQLWPYTPFMKEMISLKDQGYQITNYTQEIVRQMLPYMKESIGDANGNFEFMEVPAGEYIIEVNITWLAGNSITGGVVRKPVTLTEGQAVKVILTQ